MNYRVETDSLGKENVPNSSYYGVSTKRAYDNFNINNSVVNISLIYSIVYIKKAAAKTHISLNELSKEIGTAIIDACDLILDGKYDAEFITNSLQGGAGTSTNMNVNEVISNVALELLGYEKGSYDIIHPNNHVNMSQSTNDVYPTALRIASIIQLRLLSEEFAKLQESFQNKENEFADVIKLGRTQLMDALPIMLGQEFGAYAQAVSRDRWRLYKVEERLRQVNIGGTAIGTGMNASRKYIFAIIEELRDITNIGLARSEYPIDLTQNNDVFVEVSGLLKAAATNLLKISNDLRLMSSGPKGGFGEINLKPMQTGSSIMPGKYNPVILEMIGQISMKVISNDLSITLAAQHGQLELNSFMPLIADSLLNSLEILTSGIKLLRINCIEHITANKDNCINHLLCSTALGTALIHHIGYDRASEISKKALKTNKSIKEVLLEEKIFDIDKIDSILDPYQVTKPGIPGL